MTLAILAAIFSGHVDLSEILMLFAVVVAVVAAWVPAIGKVALLPIAVALMALAFLVL